MDETLESLRRRIVELEDHVSGLKQELATLSGRIAELEREAPDAPPHSY